MGHDEVRVVGAEVRWQRCARDSPVSPPMANMEEEAQGVASSACCSQIEPLYSVASQFQTLIAEGIATSIVKALKIALAGPDWPLGNMWWPQTRKPIRAMAMLLMAMKR